MELCRQQWVYPPWLLWYTCIFHMVVNVGMWRTTYSKTVRICWHHSHYPRQTEHITIKLIQGITWKPTQTTNALMEDTIVPIHQPFIKLLTSTHEKKPWPFNKIAVYTPGETSHQAWPKVTLCHAKYFFNQWIQLYSPITLLTCFIWPDMCWKRC